MGKADIVVIGSLNLDLVFSAPKIPSPGETVSGAEFSTYPGGKGANQAVAAARMGGSVAMIGCVGDDDYGRYLLSQLKQEDIDCSHVTTVSAPTGCAGIIVAQGENSITVADGANAKLTRELVSRASTLISSAQVLMVQLEVPLEAVTEAVTIAGAAGVRVVLDPAPACKLDPKFLERVDFITPNAQEASVLTGVDVHCWKTAALAARELRGQGVKQVLVTMGKFGAFYSSPQGEVRIAAPHVMAVDSTAAGDAFNGSLAVALVNGAKPDQAADVAAVAGALATTIPGAQPSLPRLEDVAKAVELPWQRK
jgi:ribokinase